ncbi:MAG: FAD-binding protein [Geminicoccaceae bacterium]|nr:FAD-binding protein [Geminicoccaceae bacterium]
MSRTVHKDEDRHAAALAELDGILGERLSRSLSVREHHGHGEGHHGNCPPPDAVAFARTTEEVSAIAKICNRHLMPIIPFGTGTSLEGHVEALHGGLCIDLSGFDRIVEVSPDDLDCLVGAGVTRKQLNNHLRDMGLFFPVDPGADASIGGMAATRASGTNAVRYGTMRESVLGLTVVLADGRIIKTGGRARKSSAGYDLTRLFIGSEGTLGIITEIRLRLFGIPEQIAAAVCSFPTIENAVEAVIQTIQIGLPVARIELLDPLQMRACIEYSKLHDMTAAPTLFYEFHGSETGVGENSETAQEIAESFGGRNFEWAVRPEDRNRLWQARHDAYYAGLALRKGCMAWPTDVCVPISRLARCIHETRTDIEESGLLAPIVGHVGDGNFHVQFLIDPGDPAELEKARFLNKRLVRRALAMGGTCTGEHGIGHGKIDSLAEEHGDAVQVMATIKRALDPNGIMNPGKIIG